MVKTKTGRGKSWCPSSVDLLLDIAAAVLPLGKNQWEKVAQRFGIEATAQSLPHRDAEALKRKFLLLKNVQKPTGHPDYPPLDVLRAKRLQREIESSVAVLSMNATISMDDEPDDSDDCSDDTFQSATMQSQLPTQLDDQRVEVGRTGLQPSELQALSDKLKRKQSDTGGLPSYTAKKRRSIEGELESDAKASSDMMTFLMVMRERDAKREEMRYERQQKTDRLREERVEKADRDREAREARRDELQFLLLGKIFGKNESS
ncbi:hypothetical protein H257_05832 [Aphanomyces astaci]|uniref:DUF6818 domain-containing protein n=1 Tax=Aphanomyces astaci TaxID=112090 RepID=W4GQV0_APHAT|nr:hypothetical protein H257_05832 [Aphanomyces astaci]ETV81268.1 hypothetical protein H257_05832 [Aphanomyces astaci]|eukprot:XP_009829126.1 hypothetical protein H257_05832 [Aphanomyces astaci]